jgi:serine/threonine protein kinase
MKKLSHPNVLPLREVVEDQDSYFLILKFVTGGELFDKVHSTSKNQTRKKKKENHKGFDW